jgi:hypothetical protein
MEKIMAKNLTEWRKEQEYQEYMKRKNQRPGTPASFTDDSIPICIACPAFK